MNNARFARAVQKAYDREKREELYGKRSLSPLFFALASLLIVATAITLHVMEGTSAPIVAHQLEPQTTGDNLAMP